jgi:hypothetical protein
MLREFPVAGRFAARSDWQADLGDFEREVDRVLRTIAFDDQGGAGTDGEARRLIGEQGGRQALQPGYGLPVYRTMQPKISPFCFSSPPATRALDQVGYVFMRDRPVYAPNQRLIT